MEYDLTLAQAAYALAARWDASRSVAETPALEFKKSDLDTFSSTQIGPLIFFAASILSADCPNQWSFLNVSKTSPPCQRRT
jgi:hypothetical protein